MNKNVFMTCHGMRLKYSFFKLEKNMRVFMHCTDSPLTYDRLINRYITKFIMGNKNSIYDFVKFKKIYYKIKEKDSNISTTLINSINNKKIKIIQTFKIYINEFINKISISNTTTNYNDIEKYTILKITELKKENFKLNINNVLNNLLKKDKRFYKKSKKDTRYHKKSKKDIKDYNKLIEIKNKIIKFYYMIQKIFKIEDFYAKKITKSKLEKYNDKSFNLCVFSGNLTNKIKPLLLKNKMCNHAFDLNICPNIKLYKDNGMFRDFISELPIKIEIKNKETNEIIKNSDEIIKLINHDIQKQIHYKSSKLEFSDENIEDLNINKNDFENKNIYNFLSNGDYMNYIKTTIKNYYFNINSIKKTMISLNMKIKIKKMKLNDELKKDKLKNETYIKYYEEEIEEAKEYIKKYEDILEKYNKIIEHLKKIKDLSSNYQFFIDKNEKQLFYPMGKWIDSNINDDFRNILKSYIRSYLSNKNNQFNIFPYYDIKKQIFLTNNENRKKQISEFKNNAIHLRDILIFLYDYYKMAENPNLTIDFTLLACLSGHYVPKRIYKSCQLTVEDYYGKKLSGFNSTLREYDNKVSKEKMIVEKNKIQKKSKRLSCMKYKVKDGCPSHCDIPHDKTRKSCVTKSRRRKVTRKKVTRKKEQNNLSSSVSSSSVSSSSNSSSSDSSSLSSTLF
jgi:hypothetical protein